jgi:AAA15 family ATPase/GTPase
VILGVLFIIDELEESLHIQMQKTLLREFFEHSNQSQIIFTTHNVQLLEEKIFRRDEIWFTEKSTDGASELFSLADFKPKPRKDKSLINGYLNGAFGALPLIGDLLGE